MTSWRRPPTFMPCTPWVPAGDDLADGEPEYQRSAPAPAGVELLAGGERDADYALRLAESL